MMLVCAILDSIGVEAASFRSVEPDPPADPARYNEKSASKRSLGEVCGVARPESANRADDACEPHNAAVAVTPVVDDQVSYVGIVAQNGGAFGCGHDVHLASFRQLRNERRREDYVPEEARPHNERGHSLVDLEDREERLLRDLDRPHLLHSLLSFLLLLEKLPLARDVTTVALRENVFAKRLHRRPRDDLLTDGGLDDDLEKLSRNKLLQLVRDLPSPLVRLVLVDDNGERVDRITVDEHVELHEIALPVLEHLVVERSVSPTDRLQAVEEVENDFSEGEFPVELYAGLVEVSHVPVDTAALGAERHDR